MNTPVIFIVGLPQHGKTTVRRFIEQQTGLKGGSCSDVVYRFLAMRRNTSVELLRQLPKEELRPALVRAGDFLCGLGDPPTEAPQNASIDEEVYRIPSALIRTLYHNGVRVIDGVRRRLELQDAIQHLEWNGIPSLTLFIERPGAPVIQDNTEDLRPFADEVLLNSGTLTGLEEQVGQLLRRRLESSAPGN